MPEFLYECKDCGARFSREYTTEEIRQNKQLPENQVCPKCGSKNIRRIYTDFGMRFIGSGFYVNDYKNK